MAVKHTCACPPSLPAGLPCSYYASADGGATWSSNALPVPTTPASPTAMAAVYGAALLSSTGPQLLIAGSGGHVMQTNDGGATWTDVSPVDGDGCDMLTANTIRGLQAVGNSVYAWVENGGYLKCSDSSAVPLVWTKPSGTGIPDAANLFAGSFVDASIGWLAGQNQQ